MINEDLQEEEFEEGEYEEDEDLFVLEDENGEEISFHQLARLEWEGKTYALLSLLGDENENNAMVFTVETDEDGEETLDPTDDELADELFYYFLAENEDYEFGPAE